MKILNNKAKQFLTLIIKLTIIGLAFYFVKNQLAEKPLNLDILRESLNGKYAYLYIFIILLLTFLNRFIEILKWRNLIQVIEKISIWESTKQVLSAITLGIFTPNGIGEYAGKVLFYKKEDAGKVILLNMICNGVQVIYAISFGLIGVFYINHLHNFIPDIYFLYLFLILSAAVILILSIKNIQIKGFSLESIFKYIGEIKKSIHRKNLILAFCRYFVLMNQYYFLYKLFDVEIPYFVLIGVVSAVYLLASSLPNFQIIDFALKGSVAIFLFGLFGVNEWVIAIVATLIWMLNLVIPISIGSLFVLFYKPNKTIQEK
ncbi:lysylphosphatidylglycerol synthase domain-containing protein [Flavobacterium sp. I3-2]|uniref:lysylphosphatidylglycerol synthase domain-containing protein n=1 Tax=Flavobacterium sp. I3-2 TaxID=2748319 RepID=UPI0015B2AF17|nr:lysylphosphatidylglycerol synthase domain-containing protein [Flavobacterium sp. I3-2]